MLVPKITFVFDRRKTADRQHKGSIELRITYNRRQKFISTGVTVYPHQWKGGNPYVSGYDTSGEDNRTLTAIWQKAHRIVSGQLESGEVDIDTIPMLMKPSEGSNITFMQYVMKRIEKENVAEATYRQKVSFYNKLHEYGKIRLFSDISEKAIRDFDEWLQGYEWTETDRYGNEVTKKYSQATIGSFHKNLKAFIADAVVDGYLKENVYVAKRIKVDKGSTRIEQYLTSSEIDRLLVANMPTRPLSEARDLFAMQIFSGMAYCDLMEYDFRKLKDVEVGSVCHGKRRKTGTEFVFVYTEKAKTILEKYDYTLPKTSNQKYNTKLKMVADAAGIDKPITSHDGRRSCGFFLLNAGVPIEVVSRILGHQSIRVTQSAYARILDETIIKEVGKVLK